MPFGFADTTFLDLPLGIDVQYMDSLRNASGTTFTELLTSLDGRLGEYNSVAGDSFLTSLFYPTTERTREVEFPGTFEVGPGGEYGLARAQFIEDLPAYMLPVKKWDVAMGWTEDGLRKMSTSKINRTFDAALRGMRRRRRLELLRRLFSNAEMRIPGSTNTSPGFAGSCSGYNVYVTPMPDGTALAGGYTHYIRADTAGLPAAILTARDLLKNQGLDAPYDVAATTAALPTITGNATYMVKTGSALVRSDPNEPEALVDAVTYSGVFDNDVRVRRAAITDVPGSYVVVYKTYGPLDERNPLALVFPDDDEQIPNGGRAAYLRSRSLFPLAQAEILHWYGAGVWNRVNAVLIYVNASGGYVNPTIPAFQS
jgi:hypothetical protein